MLRSDSRFFVRTRGLIQIKRLLILFFACFGELFKLTLSSMPLKFWYLPSLWVIVTADSETTSWRFLAMVDAIGSSLSMLISFTAVIEKYKELFVAVVSNLYFLAARSQILSIEHSVWVLFNYLMISITL